MKSKPNGHGSARDAAAAPLVETGGAPQERVTVASNKALQQVALVFGDPKGPDARFISFPASVARQVGKAMVDEADRAEGRRR